MHTTVRAGVSANAGIAEEVGTVGPPHAIRSGKAAWVETARLAGLTLVAAVLPLVVNLWWYDAYYWPKVQLLYLASGLLISLTLWQDRGWLRAVRSPVGIASACWLGAMALATAASVNPLVSLAGADYRYEGLMTWIAYGAVMALGAYSLTTIGRVRWLLTAVLAASVLMAILGLAQHFGARPVPEDIGRIGWGRAWGTTGSPIALGAYLVVLLPVAVSLYARALTPGDRWLSGAVVVLLYAALVATRTRGAWAAFVVACAVWLVATGAGRLRQALRPLALLGIVLVAVTPLVLLTAPRPASQISRQEAAGMRMFLWRTTVPLVWQRPLLGWGPETLVQVYPAYRTPEFLRVFPDSAMMRIDVDRPHNDLLQQAVATGLLGLAAYLWMWCMLFRTGWRAARGSHGGPRLEPAPWAEAVAAGLLGGAAGYFVQLQFSFSYVSVAPMFWTLVGTLLALERLTNSARKSETHVRMV